MIKLNVMSNVVLDSLLEPLAEFYKPEFVEEIAINLGSTFLPLVRGVATQMGSAAQAIARGEYDVAAGHLDETRAALTDYPFCDYLEGVMHLKRGNPEKALAAWRRIRPRDQDPYIRFRWLKEKLPADDAEALKILPSLAWKTSPTP